MIVQTLTVVAHHRDTGRTLKLGHLRDLIDRTTGAEDDVEVAIETRLYDGVVADVIAVEWHEDVR